MQGGTPPDASWHRVSIDGAGNASFDGKTLNLSVGNLDHARYFQSKRPGSEIFSFDVPKWFDDFVQETKIPQKGYRTNPLNQGRTAPKIVDPHQPGLSLELPPVWSEWLNEVVVPGSGRIIK